MFTFSIGSFLWNVGLSGREGLGQCYIILRGGRKNCYMTLYGEGCQKIIDVKTFQKKLKKTLKNVKT